MMKTSILSARAKCRAYSRKLYRIPIDLILVLRQRPGEADEDTRNRLIFDEFACGKVSFPAQLSVK